MPVTTISTTRPAEVQGRALVYGIDVEVIEVDHDGGKVYMELDGLFDRTRNALRGLRHVEFIDKTYKILRTDAVAGNYSVHQMH